MSKLPLISICMLTYNHESYIEEAIQSVLDQTYTNWELIIVDNASTDNTRQKIENKIANNKKIIFLPQDQNQLVSKGANIAIQTAKGSYIALFSGDDILEPEKLQKHTKFMLENDLDLSFTWVTVIGSNSTPSTPDIQKWFNDPSSTSKEDILRKYFVNQNITYAPTSMIRSSLLKKTNLFDHRLLQIQDMEWWIRLFYHTDKVAILQEKLTNYRVIENGDNLSSNNTPEKINRTNFEMIQIWKKLYNFDNDTLSKVFQTTITDENKLQIIFEHLKKNNIDVWQYAMLLEIFRNLTENCDVTSSTFKLFFKEYGNFAIVGEKYIQQKNESIQWLEQQLDNHQKILNTKEKDIAWLEEKLKTLEQINQSKNKALNMYKKLLKEVDITAHNLEQENTLLHKRIHEQNEHIKHLEYLINCRTSIKRCTKKIFKKLLRRK